MLLRARADQIYRENMVQKYGKGLIRALETLSEDEMNALDALGHPLSLKLGEVQILLCHGTPWNIDTYVYPDSPAADFEKIAGYEADIFVLGHTHYPMLKHVRGKLMINPGSVGQPRDRHPGAAWAILDTDARSVTFRCEAYDSRPLLEKARTLNPDIPYLAEVLVRR